MARTNTNVRYKSEEKRRRAIILAIILFLIGIGMVIAGTYAYYQRTITGTASGTIARWNFKANNSTSSFTISLTPTQTANTLNSTIAPETSGSFKIDLSTVDSDLPVVYEITFSTFTNKPANLKFYSDSSFTTETDITASGYKITGNMNAGTTTSKTIYWKWPYGTAASVTNDNAAADKTVSFNVNVVGTQKVQ